MLTLKYLSDGINFDIYSFTKILINKQNVYRFLCYIIPFDLALLQAGENGDAVRIDGRLRRSLRLACNHLYIEFAGNFFSSSETGGKSSIIYLF